MLRDPEEVAGRGKRRRYTEEYRRQVVEETLAPGAPVAGVALKHRLNANLVCTWRRRLLPALAPARTRAVKLLPVTITDSSATVPVSAGESIVSNKAVRRYRTRGAIEIELNGARSAHARYGTLAMVNCTCRLAA